MRQASQRGSAIIALFIAAGLFGSLAYAFAHGTRGSVSMISSEASRAAGTGLTDCENAVALARKRLAARHCGASISIEPDGSAIAGGPSDGSCSVFHVRGGGVKLCGDYDGSCLLKLAIGESCNGVVYTGSSGGNRMYTAAGFQGKVTWDSGSGPNSVTATTDSDGFINTANLVNDNGNAAAPFNAAILCRAAGQKWYLPSIDELSVMYDNRNIGKLAGTYADTGGNDSRYWSSTASDTANARHIRFEDGDVAYGSKSGSYRIRCIRRD